MFLDVCLHPVRVKIDGCYRYVPCGKCNVCLNRKQSVWISRIEQEFLCHPFAFFVTLTYDNRSVPKLELVYDRSECEYNLVDDSTGECFALSELKGFKPSSRLYVSKRKNIPYLRFKDVQDFLKRLRFYIENSQLFQNERKEQLRYFIVGEYGPTTFRPHYHAIFWLDSREVQSRFRDFVYKCWKFGNINFKRADAGTAKYVARYVNSLSSLPLVYSHKSIRPRSVCSKFPPIGSMFNASFLPSQLFYGGYRSLQLLESSGKVKDVPVWKYLENRLFPKIQNFSKLTHIERVTLYSITAWSPCEDFESFCEYIYFLLNHYKYELDISISVLVYLESMLYNDSKHPYLVNFNALRSLYFTSKRVISQAKVFNVPLEFYVFRIGEYYDMKELSKLKQFYEFQEQFALSYSASALFYLYDDYENEFKSFMAHDYDIRIFSASFKRLLVSIGFDMSMTAVEWSIKLAQCQRFKWLDNQRMSQFADKIINQSKKTKKKNDYADSVQCDFNFTLLKDYD